MALELEVGELGATLACGVTVSLRWGQGTRGMAQDPGVSCTPPVPGLGRCCPRGTQAVVAQSWGCGVVAE